MTATASTPPAAPVVSAESTSDLLWNFLNRPRTVSEIDAYLRANGRILFDVPRAIRRMREKGYRITVTPTPGVRMGFTYQAD